MSLDVLNHTHVHKHSFRFTQWDMLGLTFYAPLCSLLCEGNQVPHMLPQLHYQYEVFWHDGNPPLMYCAKVAIF